MRKIKFTKIDWLVLAILLLLPIAHAYGIDKSDFGEGGKYDIAKMAQALQANAGPIIRMLVAAAYVIGFWFIYTAVLELKAFGRGSVMMPANVTLTGPLSRLALGSFLLWLPTTVDIAGWTLWGHTLLGPEGRQYWEYPTTTTDRKEQIIQGVIAIMRVIGYISFIRGFMLLNRLTRQGAQPGTAGKGLVYIIGGIAAINIWETIQVIQRSLGFNV